jgi:Ca2+-binding RTX toxin-like protein
MASIAGSQFDATASTPVNVVITSDGSGLPPPTPGDFNLEVWTGGSPPSSPASGYQGLLVDYGGQYANLIAGAFSLADTGTGGHFIQADAAGETVVGASGDVIETQGANDSVTGNGNVILSYGANTSATLSTGNNTFLDLSGNGDSVTGGSGNNFVFFSGTGNTYTGGSGNDTIMANVGSTGDSITAGSGSDLIYSFDQNNTIVGGSGSDTVDVFANNNTVTGGSGPDTVLVVGTGNVVTGGPANDTITVIGNSNTVSGGAGSDSIAIYGSSDVFLDTHATYNDTIVGFGSGTNTINLTTNTGTTGDTAAYAVANQTPQNGGQDTLVTLNDGSTILLKGVTSVSSGFFS